MITSKKTFFVFKHPKYDHFKAVKSGWSWPGFFLNWFWGFYKGLYRYTGFSLFMAIVPLVFMYVWAYPRPINHEQLQVAELLGGMITAICAISYGLSGNKYVEQLLRAKGYILTAIVKAYDPEDAVLEAINVYQQREKSAAKYQHN